MWFLNCFVLIRYLRFTYLAFLNYYFFFYFLDECVLYKQPKKRLYLLDCTVLKPQSKVNHFDLSIIACLRVPSWITHSLLMPVLSHAVKPRRHFPHFSCFLTFHTRFFSATTRTLADFELYVHDHAWILDLRLITSYM